MKPPRHANTLRDQQQTARQNEVPNTIYAKAYDPRDAWWEISNATAAVVEERYRQLQVEEFSAKADDRYVEGELAKAAAAYALVAALSEEQRENVSGNFSLRNNSWLDEVWPWAHRWWKPKDRRADLVRAGALIIAEIERLDRAAAKAVQP